MADFFGDIFKGFLGQQDTPDITIPSNNDLLAATYGSVPQINAINTAFAQNQIPLTGIENQIRELRFPGITQLQSGTVGRILDNLNLGGSLSPELQQQVITGALQGNAASGFGLGAGGRGLVARDLGLTSEGVAQGRRSEAMNALNSFRGETLRPVMGPQTGLDLEQNRIASENQKMANEAAIRSANRIAATQGLVKFGSSVAGTFVGSAFGTNSFGSVLGGLGGGAGASGFTTAGSGIVTPGSV